MDIVRRDLAQGFYTCRTDGEGGVRCAGSGESGETLYPGHPDPAAIDLGSITPVERVVTGGAHTCTLHDGGRVKCWGQNGHGQLGLGHIDDVGADDDEMGDALAFVDLGVDFRVVTLAAGNRHSCAVSDDSRVKCWGSNLHGALGLGDVEARGDQPGEMGDALPHVDLGSAVHAVDVAVGWSFACALTESGRIKCWGRNAYGQLGIEESDDRGERPEDMGDALPYVALGTGVRAIGISAGEEHACAVLEGGLVKCWGRGADFASDAENSDHTPPPSDDYGNAGRLGLGDPHHRGREQGSMGDALPFVDLGRNAAVLGLALGSKHSCAVVTGGRLKCWGASGAGQLGLEDWRDRGDRHEHMGDALPFVDLGSRRSVLALSSHGPRTCALLDDDTVKCWGGGLEEPGRAPGTMGDALQPIDL